MAHVKIKGRKEPLIVSNESAQKILNAKKVKDENDWIVISHSSGEWNGTYGKIDDDIEFSVESKKSNKADDNIAEHNKIRREFLRLPDEVKASHLAMFKMYFQGAMDRKPTAEELEIARDAQLKFYQAHPKRMRVDVKIFDSLITKETVKITTMGRSLVNIVSALISQDIRDEKYS